MKLTSCIVWIECALMFSALGGERSRSYRMSTETNSYITTLTTQGGLSWSNGMSGGDFLIERSVSLGSGQWHPFMYGAFTNTTSTAQVFSATTPPGMVFLPGGSFLMGDALVDHSNITRPVHEVHLDPFYIAQYEFTNQELKEVLQWAFDQGLISVTTDLIYDLQGTNLMDISSFDSEISFDVGTFSVTPGRENFPCPNMSWFGAVSYCNYLSTMEGKQTCYNLTDWTCDFTKNGYRLPTEAEWEYAARAGDVGMRFPWSDTNVITHSRANYKSDSTINDYDVSPTQGFHPDYADNHPRSSPVGTFAPNSFELYDMCGNLLEWTYDWYARYSSGTVTNPVGPATGTNKMIRGGSWFTTAERATVAMRIKFIPPTSTIEDVGFRTVLRVLP